MNELTKQDYTNILEMLKVVPINGIANAKYLVELESKLVAILNPKADAFSNALNEKSPG